jgi:hypothetical protein
MVFIPPLLKMIFLPLSWHAVAIFRLLSCPIWINSSLFCTYFILLLLIFSFSFSVFPFSFPFILFCLSFFLYFSSPFHIPPNEIGWFPPPPPGEGIFQYIKPWGMVLEMLGCVDWAIFHVNLAQILPHQLKCQTMCGQVAGKYDLVQLDYWYNGGGCSSTDVPDSAPQPAVKQENITPDPPVESKVS